MIKNFIPFLACIYAILFTNMAVRYQDGWIALFDGKSLSGWKVGDNAGTFHVDSGMIIVHGNTAHLFYDGPVQQHNFKNFEFKADVMTKPGANSGIYFHTAYQQGDWPKKGYEVQVNNSHTDWRRTGSLYGIKDVKEVYVKDNEWYTEYIKVQGKRVIIQLNGKTVVDYTEPPNVLQERGNDSLRVISSGTFALQGHDPGSIVYFRNIMVKPLPE
jgi:3-keto-disaccharide hydrolase